MPQVERKSTWRWQNVYQQSMIRQYTEDMHRYNGYWHVFQDSQLVKETKKNVYIGAIQAHEDAPTSFALQAKYREEARQAFIKWDCGSRVRRGILSNATPVAGPYKVGDIVSYSRKPRAGESGI